ncbi:MAG: tyrosine-type recombinase/integrase [Methyloceanibacter sp.]
MRVRPLKGINWVPATLADGTRKEYPYLGRGRGAIRLEGGRDTPEAVELLIASHNRAKGMRRKPDPNILKSIITAFMLSPAFTKLRDRTKRDYQKIIRKIEDAFGDLPIAALNDPRVTKDLLDWRDSMAASPRQADYAWTVLMRIIAWARGRALTTYRPPEQVERLYFADRADLIWEDHHIALFASAAPEPLQWALTLAAETGLRQGDIVALTWKAYDPTPTPLSPLGWIRWTPSKSIARRCPMGRLVSIPATRRLAALLEGLPRVSPIILTRGNGMPWGEANDLGSRFSEAKNAAGITARTFNDLRGTAVTRLSEAGCTPQEIRPITGHSLGSIHRILERYCARTDALAGAAILKLEKHRG